MENTKHIDLTVEDILNGDNLFLLNNIKKINKLYEILHIVFVDDDNNENYEKVTEIIGKKLIFSQNEINEELINLSEKWLNCLPIISTSDSAIEVNKIFLKNMVDKHPLLMNESLLPLSTQIVDLVLHNVTAYREGKINYFILDKEGDILLNKANELFLKNK